MELTPEEKEQYELDVKWLEERLLERRGYIFEIPNGEDVEFLMSGGLDSTPGVDLVIKEWGVKVYPIFFRRGQGDREFEEKAFDYFVDFYKKRYPNNFIITEEELMKLRVTIPMKRHKELFPKERVEQLQYPGRNTKMWEFSIDNAIALNAKYGSDIRTILVASTDEDDYSPESGRRTLRSFMYHKCMSLDEWYWQITSPYIDPICIKSFGQERPWNKADIIRYAIDNEIPLEKTRSCFSSSPVADGTCGACKNRLAAFKYLGIKDPLPYAEVIEQVVNNE